MANWQRIGARLTGCLPDFCYGISVKGLLGLRTGQEGEDPPLFLANHVGEKAV